MTTDADRSIHDLLLDRGITHHRDAYSHCDRRHVLVGSDGRELGRFDAGEAVAYLRTLDATA